MDVNKINEAWTDVYYYLHYKHVEVLTHQNIRFMQAIYKNKNITISSLSKIMSLSHNTASEHVQRLQKKQYVERRKNPNDERQTYVTLTNLGKQVLKRNTELDEEKIRQVLDKLEPKEQMLIYEALQLLRDTVIKEFS
ncbi:MULTISPECIES: MarR family winged helix-turn-helix transcriptional regulator [Bacillus cereus group]|uniref:MarR family transcriptional regulator n=1 Tax=Bacillus cereus TaxID=1396 RepID=A0A9W7QF86_BACCE|nr:MULTISPECIES: MarR family transcriptional regulator [Bacillus cereus group]KAB2395337.1 MarR family transcriptional regulator [Bacillus cereus]KAB2408091.1 MarR family transcriptional regulator [Bacillus cereus]KAB2430950.1 MarR family transcriptional regulator [Bacillus cereus]